MQNSTITQKNKLNINALMSCIVVLLNSGYALTIGRYSVILVMTIIFLLYEWAFKNVIIDIKSNAFIFYICMILFMFVACVINLDISSYKEYVRLVVLLTLAYHIFLKYSFAAISHAFCVIMRVSSCVALAFYFIVSSFPGIPMKIVTNGYGVSYYTCYISSINADIGMRFLRNSGLFWEAGMNAAFLLIWAVFEMLIIDNNKRKYLWIIIAAVSLITTKSTSGYVYILLIVTLINSYKINRKSVYQMIVFITVLFGAIYLYLSFDEILVILSKWKPDVFIKFIYNNASVTDRLNNPLADLYVALLNPFGVGVGNISTLANQYSAQLFGYLLTSRTSTLTYYFASFGILCGALVTTAYVKFVSRITYSMLTFVIVLVCMIMLCTSTPLNGTAIFLLMLFHGISYKKKEASHYESFMANKHNAACRV